MGWVGARGPGHMLIDLKQQPREHVGRMRDRGQDFDRRQIEVHVSEGTSGTHDCPECDHRIVDLANPECELCWGTARVPPSHRPSWMPEGGGLRVRYLNDGRSPYWMPSVAAAVGPGYDFDLNTLYTQDVPRLLIVRLAQNHISGRRIARAFRSLRTSRRAAAVEAVCPPLEQIGLTQYLEEETRYSRMRQQGIVAETRAIIQTARQAHDDARRIQPELCCSWTDVRRALAAMLTSVRGVRSAGPKYTETESCFIHDDA